MTLPLEEPSGRTVFPIDGPPKTTVPSRSGKLSSGPSMATMSVLPTVLRPHPRTTAPHHGSGRHVGPRFAWPLAGCRAADVKHQASRTKTRQRALLLQRLTHHTAHQPARQHRPRGGTCLAGLAGVWGGFSGDRGGNCADSGIAPSPTPLSRRDFPPQLPTSRHHHAKRPTLPSPPRDPTGLAIVTPLLDQLCQGSPSAQPPQRRPRTTAPLRRQPASTAPCVAAGQRGGSESFGSVLSGPRSSGRVWSIGWPIG